MLPVVTAPDDVLSRRCQEVSADDPAVVALAADLLVTMAVSPGCVGLAANQVGVPWRVFCVDVRGHPKTGADHGALVMVNPVLVSATRKERAREGCMSVPDFTGDVRRATRVTMGGYLPGSGDEIEVVTDAFEARALLHELDHIDGLLFLDRVAGPHAVHPRQTYR